jgi:hypothetical protein
MKKIRISALIILMFCWSISVFAADFGAPDNMVVDVTFAPERDSIAFMTAQTATGDSALGGIDFGFVNRTQACTVTLGGTAPTSVTITMKRSTDGGTTYASVYTHTYTIATADTQTWDSNYAGRYWKAAFDSKVGGAADTAVTITCDAKE